MADALLYMENITKRFPGVLALADVSFGVEKGSVHALVGENGAGKSTLMKILGGLYTPDEGSIFIDGQKVDIRKPADAMRLGIAMVHQELNTVPEMTIAENLFLGREPKDKLRCVDKRKMEEDARRILGSMRLDFNVEAPIKTLSLANMQMVEIAKAVSADARILIMDEPTSSLTDRETEVLFEQITDLKGRGVSVIYISHKLEELYRVADTATILRDGKTICTAAMDTLTREDIIRHMVGRTIENYYPAVEDTAKQTVMRVEGLCAKGEFDKISFEVKAGEILGVSGLIGAGRTELFSAIFGLQPYSAGHILLDEKAVKIRAVRDAVRNGIVMVPEDRKLLGLVLMRSVAENITLPYLWQYRSYWLNRRAEQADVIGQITKLKIKTASVANPVSTLSGGNQQKVVLAKWLLRRPKVLILDEPTRGIDVGSKQEIYKLMRQLAKEGMAIVMISSELPEILGMSNRVLVMANGRITGELTHEQANSERIMQLAMGE